MRSPRVTLRTADRLGRLAYELEFLAARPREAGHGPAAGSVRAASQERGAAHRAPERALKEAAP